MAATFLADSASANSFWSAAMVVVADCWTSEFALRVFNYWRISVEEGVERSESARARVSIVGFAYKVTGFLLSLGMKLTSQLVDTGQERLVHLMLPAELVLEIPSLVDLSLGSLQDLVFSLQVFDDFLLQKKVG
jgi:hypothetical protein